MNIMNGILNHSHLSSTDTVLSETLLKQAMAVVCCLQY